MKKSLILFKMLLLTLLFGNLPAAGQTNLVKLDSGLKYEISNLTDKFVLHIPITPEPGVKMVKLSKVDVSLGDKHDQNLFEAFQAELKTMGGDNNAVPAIIVTVNTAKLEQGTYKLLLLIQPELPDDSRKQNIILELTVPPTRVQLFGDLKLRQIAPFWGNAENSGNTSLVLLQTTSQRAVLKDFSIVQATVNAEDGEPTAAKVLFAPKPEAISATSQEMAVSFENVFPLGTTYGTALITSPQLAEPVSVPFEVKVRRPQSYILWMIVIGLIASFLVRTYAQKQINLYKARQKADDAIEALNKEISSRQDQTFRGEIEQVISGITQAKNSKDAVAMAAAVANANEALNDALTELGGRREKTLPQIEKISRLNTAGQSLPVEFANIFEIKNDLEDLKSFVQTDNIGAAKDKLNDLVSKLHGEVEENLSDWRPSIESFLIALKNLPTFLASSAMEDNLNHKLDDLLSLIQSLPSTIGPEIEDLAAITDSLEDIQLRIKELLITLALNVAHMIASLRAQFESTHVKNKLEVNEFFEKLNQFQKKPAEWMASPAKKAEQVQKDMIELEKIWKETMLSLVENNPAVKTEVEKLLNERRHRDSAARTIEYLRNVRTTLGGTKTVDSAVPSSSEPNFYDITPTALDSALPVKVNNFTFIKSETTVTPIFDVLESGSWWNYALANLIVFLVAGAGITAVGYFLFVNKFVGTWADMFAIFVWAFGTDVSINTFVSLGTNFGDRLKS